MHKSYEAADDGKWLGELDQKQWLLEEYKLLSLHYFHEDDSLRKTITTYITINAALLAFLGSTFAAQNSSINIAVSIIGLVLCVVWFVTLIRIREWRFYIEERIETIEKTLHGIWTNSILMPLDIRAESKWAQIESRKRWYNVLYFLFRDIPSSLMHFVLPIAFLIVWIMVIFFKL